MTKCKGQVRSGVIMNATNSYLPEVKQKRIANGIQEGKEKGLMHIHPLYQLADAISSNVNDLRKYLSANMGLMNKTNTDLIHDTYRKRHSFGALLTPNYVDPLRRISNIWVHRFGLVC